MDKLITRKEAASILGISVKTLDAARTDGLISYVQYVENGEITSFTGTDIIPYAMGGPFEAYIVTNLSGTIQDGTMSLSMTCGSNPITYSGTIACDL